MANRQRAAKQHPEIEKYVETVKQKSENLVKLEFPNKIVELNRLLESPDFNVRESSKYYDYTNFTENSSGNMFNHNNHDEGDSPQGKKRKLEKVDGESAPTTLAILGSTNCNKNITRLIDIVKPHIRDLVEDANLVHKFLRRNCKPKTQRSELSSNCVS